MFGFYAFMTFKHSSIYLLQYESVMSHLEDQMANHLARVSDSPRKMIRCNDKFEDSISQQSLWGYDLLHVCHKEVKKLLYSIKIVPNLILEYDHISSMTRASANISCA